MSAELTAAKLEQLAKRVDTLGRRVRASGGVRALAVKLADDLDDAGLDAPASSLLACTVGRRHQHLDRQLPALEAVAADLRRRAAMVAEL